MATKPHGKDWTIREQIIEDPVSGLTFQFDIDNSGTCWFRVIGDALPFGNREFLFSESGDEAGAGTYAAKPRLSFLSEVGK